MKSVGRITTILIIILGKWILTKPEIGVDIKQKRWNPSNLSLVHLYFKIMHVTTQFNIKIHIVE